jgi:alpha-1,2-mannosyltransferase
MRLRRGSVLGDDDTKRKEKETKMTFFQFRKSKEIRTVQLLYPSCDFTSLATIPLDPENRVGRGSQGQKVVLIMSLAQFRPEKEHGAQVAIISEFLTEFPEWKGKVRLVMAGGVRDAGDEKRVDELKKKVSELGLKEGVSGFQGQATINA